ncbi:MAG: hypothetical protein R3B47_21745, partial [Bacteroidia bacterium]
MLGIILIIFVARYIGNMAEDRGKTKWHFWLATVGVWYGSQFAFSFLVGIIIALIWGEQAVYDLVE